MHISGTARVGDRTKDLVKRLDAGDIAVIDHQDLDEVAAHSLIAAKVRAVVNAAPAITGRYPNQGPRLLLESGIPLIDSAGAQVMTFVDGEPITIKGTEIFSSKGWVAVGRVLTNKQMTELLEKARANMAHEVAVFVDNTLSYAEKEKEYYTNDISLPPLPVTIKGRHVLVVVRGASYKEDLRIIDSYIREVRPVLLGVDGGADALLEAGYKPDIIIGDMDSVSDKALQCGALLLVQAYLDGRAPGAQRLATLELEGLTIRSPGTSEDLALLIAYQAGAELIVAVGAHSSMVDFLEKGRPGMASTILVRMKVGAILVDAKGVSRLYQGKVKGLYPLQVAVAALVPVLLVGLLSDHLRQWVRLLLLRLRISMGF